MSTRTRLLPADQFLTWPDQPGRRQELVRGAVVSMSLPGLRHGKIAGKILRLIGNHVEAAGQGDTYSADTGLIVERDPDTVRGADVAFVRSERLAAIIHPEKHVPFAPDLAVEVRSPSDRDVEVEEKVQTWLESGTRMVWKVDPERRTVTVYRPGAEPVTLGAGQEITGDDVVSGFRCIVADFFA